MKQLAAGVCAPRKVLNDGETSNGLGEKQPNTAPFLPSGETTTGMQSLTNRIACKPIPNLLTTWHSVCLLSPHIIRS